MTGAGARLAVLVALALGGCRQRPSTGSAADSGAETGGEVVEADRQLLGTDFRISIADVPEERAHAGIEAAFAEVSRVERLLSSHVPTSDVSRINDAAGREPVVVSSETIALIEEAREVSDLSDGALDVSFAPLMSVWASVREDPPRIPTEEAIREALALVGYRRIVVDRDRHTVQLPVAGMRIGLGAIGKGYAVDKASEVLRQQGIASFIVGGGGDLYVQGSKRGVPWRLGIQHPRNRSALIGEISFRQPGAIVTSGDYERFVEVDGVRYHHIFDPRTGRSARGCSSVTLLAETATRADALATAVFVLGPEAGMRLVDRLPGVEAVIVDEALHVTMSPRLRGRVRLIEPL